MEFNKLRSLVLFLFVFDCGFSPSKVVALGHEVDPETTISVSTSAAIGAGDSTQGPAIRNREYQKPQFFTFLQEAPGDIRDFGKITFKKDKISLLTWITVGTGLLIVADQYLVDKSQMIGDHLNISHANHQETIASIDVPFSTAKLRFEGPFDSGSMLYFIGDGWVDVGLIGGFFSVGLIKSDNRALQTSSQIAESILASGTVVQVLKHVTGRNSPFTTQIPRGVWHFFPNQFEYAKHVPEYDAYPSGHLCAGMAALTVMAENYPEYGFIRPVGYSLLGILSFQMMNNGVHWPSDYPLAIYMGYEFGHIAVQKGRRSHKQASDATIEFSPMLVRGGMGIEARYRFGSPSFPRKRESRLQTRI